MSEIRCSRPRFKRTGDRPNIQITDDDDQILFHVFRHRVIDSAMIYALFPDRSAQKLSRRLQALWQAGYLDRPTQQLERIRTGGGSAPLVYTLDRYGAQRLRDLHGVDTNPIRWRQKNREIRGRSIQHALATTRFMVSLELAARAHGSVSLLHTDDVLALFSRSETVQPGARLTLRAAINWHGHYGEEGTAPDRLFGLQYDEREEGKNRQFILLEIDQGTETIEPGDHRVSSKSFFRDTSILRKMVVYASAFKQKTHQQRFGFRAFRVLTVTTNRARVEQMQATYRKHFSAGRDSVNPGLFLFTDWTSWLSQAGYERVVENAAGQDVSLI